MHLQASAAPLCGGTVLQGSANLCGCAGVDPKTSSFTSTDPESDPSLLSHPECDMTVESIRTYRMGVL